MIQQQTRNLETLRAIKPLLRGWFHAVAAVCAVALTVVLCWLSRGDIPKLISMLIFGLSMIELYTISAIYHIGTWSEPRRRLLRALDHANIFVLIAGTYTPLCFNSLSIFTLKLPRWVTASLYISMGWVAILALPAFLAILHWTAVAMLTLGGILYTIGAVIYAQKRPDPFPKVFGFHEVFHLFVIAGGVAFAACVWIWALPFPRK